MNLIDARFLNVLLLQKCHVTCWLSFLKEKEDQVERREAKVQGVLVWEENHRFYYGGRHIAHAISQSLNLIPAKAIDATQTRLSLANRR